MQGVRRGMLCLRMKSAMRTSLGRIGKSSDSPQVNTSTSAALCSGHVCTVRCDSSIVMVMDTPCGASWWLDDDLGSVRIVILSECTRRMCVVCARKVCAARACGCWATMRVRARDACMRENDCVDEGDACVRSHEGMGVFVCVIV